MSTKCMAGKVLLGFGCASGMGKASALRFAKAGATVVIADLPTQPTDEVVAEIVSGGGTAVNHPCDVTDPAQVQSVVDKTIETFGRIDSMIFMPGANPLTRIMDISLETWNSILNLNLTSAFVALQCTSRAMKDTGGGSIILTSSLNSTVFRERFGCYSVTKIGLDMLARVAALEMGQYKIRVNTICPGYMNTPIMQRRVLACEGNVERIKAVSPSGRLGEAEDFAKLAMFLCSDDGEFISGQNIVLDGAAGHLGYPDIMGPLLKQMNDPRY